MVSEREYHHIINKQRNLPCQLERARRRVRDLEMEAVRYGMVELLSEVPEHG